MRYPRENDFDAFFLASGARWNVPVPLLKALTAVESEFSPRAIRQEPQLKPVNIPGLEQGGDASRGLMQLLYRTAWALGYHGAADGLYDPKTNIDLGAKYFGDLLAAAVNNGYGIGAAVSSYNAGGSADRYGDGKRSTSRKDGRVSEGGELAPFVNQAYVNKVLALYDYFRAAAAVDSTAGHAASSSSRSGKTVPTVLIAVAGAAVLLFFFRQASDVAEVVGAGEVFSRVDAGITRLLIALVGAEAALTAWMLRQAWSTICSRLDSMESSVTDLRMITTVLAQHAGMLSIDGGRFTLHDVTLGRHDSSNEKDGRSS